MSKARARSKRHALKKTRCPSCKKMAPSITDGACPSCITERDTRISIAFAGSDWETETLIRRTFHHDGRALTVIVINLLVVVIERHNADSVSGSRPVSTDITDIVWDRARSVIVGQYSRLTEAIRAGDECAKAWLAGRPMIS